METYIPYLLSLIASVAGKVTTMDGFFEAWCVYDPNAWISDDPWLIVYLTILQAVACIY